MGIPLRNLPASVQQQIAEQAGRRPRNKYGVAPVGDRSWSGRVYASKAEMHYAQHLRHELEAGRLREVVEQPKVWLTAGFAYRPDFLVIADEAYYIDIKGKGTQRFRDACRMWSAHGRLPLRIVIRQRGEFVTDHVIVPVSDNNGGNGNG